MSLKTNPPNGNSAFVPQGQSKTRKIAKQNGNFAPQVKPQQNQTHNFTSGGGQSAQKVQQKQQNGKGVIPLLNNNQNGQPHKQ